MGFSAERSAGRTPDPVAAFDHPAFSHLKTRGAAFLILRTESREVVWANGAAARFWNCDDLDGLAVALMGQANRPGWLGEVMRDARPALGQAPSLLRLGPALGLRIGTRTALCRRWLDPDGSVLVALAVPETATRTDGPADRWLDGHVTRPARNPAPSTPAADGPEEDPSDPDAMDLEPADPAQLWRRSRLAVLRDRLGAALDGASSLRLLWRSDADGVVHQADPRAMERLGCPVSLQAVPLCDTVAAFDAAAADALRGALAGRVTWSGIVVRLPVSDGAAILPMVMSASPIFGPDRMFAGFRGFGALDLVRLEPVPSRRGHDLPGAGAPLSTARDLDAPADAPADAAPSAGGIDGPSTAVTASAPATEASTAAPREETDPLAEPADNVVRLRPLAAIPSGRTERALLAAEGHHAAAPAETRQTSDELAFIALGEALRARIGQPPADLQPATGTEPAADAAETRHDVAEQSEAMVVSQDDGTRSGPTAELLDTLSLGLLVLDGSRPVFVDATAARVLGYADPPAVLARGQDLVVARSADAPAAVLELRNAHGTTVQIGARPAEVVWEGRPATAWLLATEAEASRSPLDEAAATHWSGAFDPVDDAVLLLEPTGLILDMNRRARLRFSRRDSGPLGDSLTDHLAPESRAVARALLAEAREASVPPAEPLRRDVLARNSGPAVAMRLTVGRLGRSHLLATLRDVSAQPHPEVDRSAHRQDQTREMARLSELLAKVSHEIRTPLNAILGFAEVMIDERFGPLGNARYKDYLRDVHASGVQVLDLVSDLLNLSTIEAGQVDLDVAPIDVNRIVSETVARMQPEAHRERVIMRTSLGHAIPAALVDESSARQIVQYLLSNAVKFNEPGGQVIVSTTVGDGGGVVLRVRDTGVGMTEDEVAAALDPFPQMASSRPPNGLGLPLTRALVGANGASMAIRSRPQEGTLVEIVFAAAPGERMRHPA